MQAESPKERTTYHEFMKAEKRFETHEVFDFNDNVVRMTGMCRVNAYVGPYLDTAMLRNGLFGQFVYIRRTSIKPLFVLFTGWVKYETKKEIIYIQYSDRGVNSYYREFPDEVCEKKFKETEIQWITKHAFINKAVRDRLTDIYIFQ